MNPASASKPDRWYRGISAANWMVLLTASAGWVFDAFEGQIFNVTRDNMLADLLGLLPGDPAIKFWGDVYLGIYLVGGAIGGVMFGSLADRIGRRTTLILTILTYSIFSGLTYFAQAAWQVAVLRFFVALGTAGEWAVAATLVAEAFPPRSRAQAGGIFHSTSNVGNWLAAFVGLLVGTQWRYAYLIGVLPALLVLWVRSKTPESENWARSQAAAAKAGAGSVVELLRVPVWRRRAVLGLLFGAVGLSTYWCLAVAGLDLVKDFLLRHGVAETEAVAKSRFAYGVFITAGGLVGALTFGSFAHWLGRRKAFAWAMVGGVVIVPITCYLPATYGQLLCLLPVYGFLTYGFHGGFAHYFPELFPTHLRGVGTGFCFNGGRMVAAGVLLLSGWLKSSHLLDLRQAMSCLALLYLLGLVFILFLPETANQQLEDE